jgi:hypothetical protein
MASLVLETHLNFVIHLLDLPCIMSRAPCGTEVRLQCDRHVLYYLTNVSIKITSPNFMPLLEVTLIHLARIDECEPELFDRMTVCV